MVAAGHEGGALVGWQVGSVEEAAAAEDAGCDYVVAQGIEAGGHVRGKLPVDEVLGVVLKSVRIPVIAAGGVATPERVSELIRAGADGARVGTRFVTSPESGAHPEYVARLLAAGDDSLTLTEWFGDGWEGAPHRVLKVALIAAQESGWRATVPPYRSIERSPVDMAMYAGTGVTQVTSSLPAVEVVADLVSRL